MMVLTSKEEIFMYHHHTGMFLDRATIIKLQFEKMWENENIHGVPNPTKAFHTRRNLYQGYKSVMRII